MLDYEKLKKLRNDTGVSFSLCKTALEESENDIPKAMAKLKIWGAKKAKEKSDKKLGAGGIFSYVHHNRKIASLVELQSETDFVSGNSDFQKLGAEIAMQVASVPAESPEDFLKQEYIRDPSKTMADLIKEAVLKFGENIQLTKMLRWALDN